MATKAVNAIFETDEGVFPYTINEGEFLLTPEYSREHGIHVYQILNALEKMSKDLEIDHTIDIQPNGVLFTWSIDYGYGEDD